MRLLSRLSSAPASFGCSSLSAKARGAGLRRPRAATTTAAGAGRLQSPHARRNCQGSRGGVLWPAVSRRAQSVRRLCSQPPDVPTPPPSEAAPALELDHVCVVVKDMEASIRWYSEVLGLTHVFADEPSFGRTPAFMRAAGQAGVAVALWPLSPRKRGVDELNPGFYPHNGAHLAFRLPRDKWDEQRRRLPGVLAAAQQEPCQAFKSGRLLNVYDYTLQLSMFFQDPSQNLVELTTWVAADEPRRL